MKKIIILTIVIISCFIYYNNSKVPYCNGIDISHYNDVKWNSLDSTVEFCYIKATEGKSFKDRMCVTHSKNAKRSGIKVGLYHYFRTGVSPEEQFNNFKKIAKLVDSDLIPAIDVEKTGNNFDNVSEVNKNLTKLIDLFEQEYGQKPLIYLGSWDCIKIIKSVYDCPIWLRFIECYNFIPNTTVKQYNIVDNLDRNYCKNINKLII